MKLSAMRSLDSLRLFVSLSPPHPVHFARFNLLPLMLMCFPHVILLLSRFSDKKLERGKWSDIYFLSFPPFLSSPLCPFLALIHPTSLFLAVTLTCISFHTQGPNEIKLYSHLSQWRTCCCCCTCVSSVFLLKWCKVWFSTLSVFITDLL